MRGTDHPRGAAGAATPPARSPAVGDEDAFAALAQEHCAPLFAYARVVTLDDGEAASAVRRAFGTLRMGVEPGADHSLTLVRRTRASCLETIARHPPEPGSGGDGPPALAAAAAGPEARLRAALAGLPVAQRDALALREVGGLSYDEIAAITGRSPVAAAQLMWRGSGRLRSLMAGHPGGVSVGSRECERALTLMTLAEDLALPEELAAGVQRHLASCPHCPASLPAIAGARSAYRRGARVTAADALAQSIAAQSGVDRWTEAPPAGSVVVDARSLRSPGGRRRRAAHGGRRRLRPLLPALATALALTATALAIELGPGRDDRANFARDATERMRGAGTPLPAVVRPPAGERPERGDGQRVEPRPTRRRRTGNARELVAAAPARATAAVRPSGSATPAPASAPPAAAPPPPARQRPPAAPAPGRRPPAADPAPADPAPGGPPPAPAAPTAAPSTPAAAPAAVSARRAKGPPGLGGDVPPGHGGAPPGHSPGLPPGRGGGVLPPGHGKKAKKH